MAARRAEHRETTDRSSRALRGTYPSRRADRRRFPRSGCYLAGPGSPRARQPPDSVRFMPWAAARRQASGALAQWQSSGLLIRRFRVRAPDAPPLTSGFAIQSDKIRRSRCRRPHTTVESVACQHRRLHMRGMPLVGQARQITVTCTSGQNFRSERTAPCPRLACCQVRLAGCAGGHRAGSAALWIGGPQLRPGGHR